MRALPNVTAAVTAITKYVGVVSALGKTAACLAAGNACLNFDVLTLNLALGTNVVPGLPAPAFPATPETGTVHNFAVVNRIGNGAPDFVCPLGNPFKLAGKVTAVTAATLTLGSVPLDFASFTGGVHAVNGLPVAQPGAAPAALGVTLATTVQNQVTLGLVTRSTGSWLTDKFAIDQLV